MRILTMLFLFIFIQAAYAESDPLPSWNEGKVKSAILQFVKESTNEGGENYIFPEERIAVFDQDGTLWVEKPYYTQLHFIADRIKDLLYSNPELKKEELFASILESQKGGQEFLNEADIEKASFASFRELSVDAYHEAVRHWLKRAAHPRYNRPYTELVYQPMLEVMQLFENEGFKNYIVSGGGQEFMRAYAWDSYNIPPERIIGSACKVSFEWEDGQPVLQKLPLLFLYNDKKGKPENINLMIGRKPVAAFGNSKGDQQMLEWTQARKGINFELLVSHDDAGREYAYGENSLIGSFPQTLMDEAKKNGWHVASMRDDWKTIFPWEKEQK